MRRRHLLVASAKPAFGFQRVGRFLLFDLYNISVYNDLLIFFLRCQAVVVASGKVCGIVVYKRRLSLGLGQPKKSTSKFRTLTTGSSALHPNRGVLMFSKVQLGMSESSFNLVNLLNPHLNTPQPMKWQNW